MTPQEQMRALADRLAAKADWMLVFADTDEEVCLLQEAEAALRDAADLADEVPDVRAYRDAYLDSPNLDPVWVAGWHAAIDHVTHILTTPTPQEARMSKCDWPECPGRPKSVEKHEIESGPELHPQCKDAILLAERARREDWHTIPKSQETDR